MAEQTIAQNSPPSNLQSLSAIRGYLFCLAIMVSALVYSFHLMSFLHAKEMVLCVALLLLVGLGCFARVPVRLAIGHFLPLWVFVVLILLRLTLAPVAVPAKSVEEAARWLLMILALTLVYDLFLDVRWRRRLLGVIHFSAVAVAILGIVQYTNVLPGLFPVFANYTQRVYSVFGNQDLFGGYLAMALPLMIRRTTLAPARHPASALAALLLTVGLLISASRSAWIAAAAGTLIAFPWRHLRWRGAGATVLLMAVAVAGTAWYAPDATVARLMQGLRMRDEGVQSRLGFWRASWLMFEQAPILGVGAGNYAYWSPLYVGEVASRAHGAPGFDPQRHADHPHCEPLRILVENGLIGLFCCIWMLARLLHRRGSEWGALTAFLVFACFNGPLQSVPHTLAALVFAALLLTRDLAATADSREPFAAEWSIRLPAAAMAVAVAVFFAWAVVYPSYLLREAENAHVAKAECISRYQRTLRHTWPNAEARKNYAIALAETGNDAEAATEFEKALAGLDTGDIYLVLAALAARHGATDAAHKWAEECLRRWPGNPEATRMLEMK